jgi:hypothetical protein
MACLAHLLCNTPALRYTLKLSVHALRLRGMLGRDLFVRSDRLVVRRRECRTIVRRLEPAFNFPERSKHFAQSPLGHAQSCRMQLISLNRVFEKAKSILWQIQTRRGPRSLPLMIPDGSTPLLHQVRSFTICAALVLISSHGVDVGVGVQDGPSSSGSHSLEPCPLPPGVPAALGLSSSSCSLAT